jgi:hypothetical protein
MHGACEGESWYRFTHTHVKGCKFVAQLALGIGTRSSRLVCMYCTGKHIEVAMRILPEKL